MTDQYVSPPGRAVDDMEVFEREQLVRDRDRYDTIFEFSESYARDVVEGLIEDALVEVVPDAQQYVHIASGERFKSVLALAYFQQGWEARDDADL
ncbi:hypothetical protein [Halorubellus sp. PRR65]|uniref:hypothetical protein n=1 Tax=Halorubellus sp. PRR65 TaxID=3098148 RepID=UPI002B26212A|nr:hypothetical protein [Halorubellus sp. PRR65]